MKSKNHALIYLIQQIGTQEEIGVKIKRSQQCISNWVNGYPIPLLKAFELEKLAKERGIKNVTVHSLVPSSKNYIARG